MSEVSKCARCRQDLTNGGYCLACGHNNEDLESRRFKAEAENNRRLENAKLLSGLFRAIGWINRVS